MRNFVFMVGHTGWSLDIPKEFPALTGSCVRKIEEHGYLGESLDSCSVRSWKVPRSYFPSHRPCPGSACLPRWLRACRRPAWYTRPREPAQRSDPSLLLPLKWKKLDRVLCITEVLRMTCDLHLCFHLRAECWRERSLWNVCDVARQIFALQNESNGLGDRMRYIA